MTTPIIGSDCDITLTHPQVNSGEPCGFILAYDPSVRGNSLSVQRNVDADSGEISIRIFLTVILADDLKNPDCSHHSQGRSEMYARLIEYLATTDGLSINTVMGTFTGVAPTGFSATELHQPLVSHCACQFNNVSTYHPPITSAAFFESEWDGDLTWASSYWR